MSHLTVEDIPLPFYHNDKFKSAYRSIFNTTNSYHIIGMKGSGLTALMKCIIRKEKDKVLVITPTLETAVKVNGLPIEFIYNYPTKEVKKLSDLRFDEREMFVQVERIVLWSIAEFSSKQMRDLDKFLRAVKQTSRTFGSLPLVFFGDVLDASLMPKDMFFTCRAIEKLNLNKIELKENYIYPNTNLFLNTLNLARRGDEYALERVNNTCFTWATRLKRDPFDIPIADPHINVHKYIDIDVKRGKKYKFVQDNLNWTRQYQELSPIEFDVKIGSKVRFTRDAEYGDFSAGDIGIFKDVVEGEIIIELKGNEILTIEARQELKALYNSTPIHLPCHLKDYSIANGKKFNIQIIGEVTFFPFEELGVLSMKNINQVSIGSTIIHFKKLSAEGRLYQILQRCTSLKSLQVTANFTKKDIQVREDLLKYYEN